MLITYLLFIAKALFFMLLLALSLWGVIWRYKFLKKYLKDKS